VKRVHSSNLGGNMTAGVRTILFGIAMVLATIDTAAAQLETVVVTAEKREGYGGAQAYGPSTEPPHLFVPKRADHLITSVRVTCDTRDFSQRRQELKETLRSMIRAAAGSATISLGIGEQIIVDLNESGFDDLIGADSRPDTSAAVVIIKTKVSANDTLSSAMARVTQFIETTPKAGRTEILREGECNLTIVGPEQYRDSIVALIVSDARHTADMFGAGYGISVEGLEHRVSWYQRGPLDLGLYIPYTLKITPAAH
jgi:hypothetical protein